MGKRGPKPQSAAKAKLKGNPGKRPVAKGKGKPGPSASRPKCPAFLGDAAKAKWAELVPSLERLGVLTEIDGDVLAAYCSAWEEFEAATKILTGATGTCDSCSMSLGRYALRGTGGMASHPAVAQQRSAWRAVKEFATLLGLHLGSRKGLGLGEEAGEEEDELEGALGGKK